MKGEVEYEENEKRICTFSDFFDLCERTTGFGKKNGDRFFGI